jgi:hypothetical protein
MIHNASGKIEFMANLSQPLMFCWFLLKFNHGTGGDADDCDMIQGGFCCPSLRLASNIR